MSTRSEDFESEKLSVRTEEEKKRKKKEKKMCEQVQTLNPKI